MRSLVCLARASLLVIVVAAVGGCFVPKEPECAFACDFASGGACPSGYTCLADNYCHKGNHVGPCTDFPQRDAAVPQTDAQADVATGCSADNCADGCCDGDTCLTGTDLTAAKCGTGGAACAACDSDKADTCVAGVCSCGSAGTPAECGTGLHCGTGGTCLCNATTGCDGCCDGNSCVALASVSKQHCGSGGEACAACDTLRADSCVGGECTCGSATECATGQRCNSSAACVCDTSSGCSGCCSGANCVASSLDHCGTGGEACDVCSGADPKGDACDSGDCKCGGNSACTTDQECTGGACVCLPSAPPPCCDSVNCPSGCCASGTCTTPVLTACGSAGGSCTDCTSIYGNRANLCNGSGACVCGSGTGPCAVGQRCVGTGTAATCQCDATSCANGCCDGTGACRTLNRDKDHCGSGGNACAACPITGDSCDTTTGACECANNTSQALCGTGLRCGGSGCVCDTTSNCTGCCSSATTCAANDISHCGAGGVSCWSCQAAQTSGIANGCGATAGTCACGPGSACAADQACTGSPGSCTCGVGSHCSGGCCNGGGTGHCVTSPTFPQCGTGGATCWSCDNTLSSACGSTAGQCLCGSGAACAAADQVCNTTPPPPDVCECDQTKCATLTGCCAGTGHCVVHGTFPNCAQANGNACTGGCSLLAADRCVGAVCSCGPGGAACAGPTDTCTGGTCYCGGGAACAGTTDTCTGGNCYCGGGAACAAQNEDRCTSGLCKCGAADPCSGLSDKCVGQACHCGDTGAACSGQNVDRCTGGACKCGTNNPCTGMSDKCVGTACHCGDTGAACSAPSADRCTIGACKCGTSDPCGTNQECVSSACVYTHTIVIDGTNDFVTGAVGAGESFATTSGAYTAYVAWDLANLYIGYTGPDVTFPGDADHWVLIYLDTDPAGSNGTTAGQTYNAQQPTLPFAADYHLRWSTDDIISYSVAQSYSSSWQDYALTGFDHSRLGSFVEFKIPFASIGNPATLRVLTFMINDAGTQWTYAGIYSGSFTDGTNPSLAGASYLLVDRASAAYPNAAANKKP